MSSPAQQPKFESPSSAGRNPLLNDVIGNNSGSNSSHTEQPQTKRQKMENVKNAHTTAICTNPAMPAAMILANKSQAPPPPDVLDPGEHKTTHGSAASHNLCSSLSSSANSISAPSSCNNSPTSTPFSSRTTSLSQLLNVQSYAATSSSSGSARAVACDGGGGSVVVAGKMSTTPPPTLSNGGFNSAASSVTSIDEVDRMRLPDLLPLTTMAIAGERAKASAAGHVAACCSVAVDASSTARDMREFESALTKQCLCGVSEHTLRKPFQSHFSRDTNGQKRIANLSEWPTKKLVQFLSNLQLLFDIYLKQNSKGFICGRIMDVCDALIRNDNNLIDEIIVLANYDNAYVQFLAGRVLAAFLVIAKQEMNDNWLKKLVDNLFSFDQLDHVAVQKVHFSLDIIKRIVEWKDIDLHPLEDEIVDASEAAATTSPATDYAAMGGGGGAEGYLHFQTQQPTLETNYFAVHFCSPEPADDDDDADVDVDDIGDDAAERHRNQHRLRARAAAVPAASGSAHMLMHGYDLASRHRDAGHDDDDDGDQLFLTMPTAAGVVGAAAPPLPTGCHIVTLTDSESFDTTHLKCVTIKILENKWPGLVKNMSALIANHLNIDNAEICILNFLALWENIISVKANLSIVETLPFYAQLVKMELLLNRNLSCTVYKQMLSLFNEALCYGSTLALQDILPDETCLLAHQIVRHVKDFRILESLPRRQTENVVSFIGFRRTPVVYDLGSLHTRRYMPMSMVATTTMSNPLAGNDVIEMDKTILQKMVLLVLKSIAVTVKEIRSDSSDSSSIDSIDSDAYQDMVLIQRSIHDVLHKLESFIKHTLEFHPECHFSKILIHLFDDQDDHLIEAMVCTLDVTAGINFRNNAFPELVTMLNPVYTFLEFLQMITNSPDVLLDLLVHNETCFLLYLLRFLKYIRTNWPLFVRSCSEFDVTATHHNHNNGSLDVAMTVLIRLRLQISRLVSQQLYPYEISPVLRLLESCESLYEGSELS